MSRFVRIPSTGPLLALALLIGCGSAGGQPSGEADFRMSCSACHGDDGRGAGTKAFGLSVEPPDLTTLRQRNNGVFPRERLRGIIDGREDINTHTDREMPVWGQLFKRDAEEGLGGADGDEATIEQRIETLIDFIVSFQR
jgi:hypothetical protein